MAGSEGAFARGVSRVSLVGGYLAAISLVAILLLVGVEIVMRGVFGRSTQFADEFAGYLNAALIFLGLGYTLQQGLFIRIEAIYARLRGGFMRAVQWLIVIWSIVYIAVLLFYVVKQIVYLYSANVAAPSTSQIPLYLPQLVMGIGCAILLAQFLAYVIRRLRGLP